MIRRALSTVRDSGIQEVLISGRAGTDYSTLGCPVLFDLEPGCGPLGGIERALSEATAPLVLVLAVDLPGITAAFLRKLAAHCDPLTGAVPKLKNQLEPLAAIYPKRCHFIVRDCLLRFRHAARDFADACLRERAVRTFTVPGTDANCFDNWNSPADVAALQQAVPSPVTRRHPDEVAAQPAPRHLKWLPVIDPDLCTGCDACVEACGPKSLQLVNKVASLVRSDTCGSEEHCIAPCPTGAIQMAWLEHSGNLARGKWRVEPSMQ